MRPKLTFGITALKGTIEEFLSKDVKYLITDKPEKDWPAKPENRDENGEAGSLNQITSASTALPASTVPSSLCTAISQATASSIATAGKSTTTDVLEIAMRRNVKIISAQRMLEFLMNRVLYPGVSVPGSGENLMRGISLGETDSFASSRERNKSLRAVKFKAPFIKVEAHEQTTRPFWKVFQTWPDILFDSNTTGCPFKNTSQSAAALTAARVTAAAEKLNLTSSATAAMANVNGNGAVGGGTNGHSQSHNSSNAKNSNITNGHSQNIRPPNGPGCKEKATATATTVESATNKVKTAATPLGSLTNASPLTIYNSPILNLTQQSTTNHQTTNQLTHLGSLPRQPIPLTASATITASSIVLNGPGHRPGHLTPVTGVTNASKRRKMWCEICSVEYSCIREHLKSYKHNSYIEDNENFRELVNTIKSLPSLNDLLTESEN